jgi:hypothetical protein
MTGETEIRAERTGDGFTVPAEWIAAGLGLAPAEVGDLMRRGEITGQCEKGVDADAGRWRLTFHHRGRRLRLTLDDEGRLLKRTTFDAPARKGPAGTAP